MTVKAMHRWAANVRNCRCDECGKWTPAGTGSNQGWAEKRNGRRFEFALCRNCSEQMHDELTAVSDIAVEQIGWDELQAKWDNA